MNEYAPEKARAAAIKLIFNEIVLRELGVDQVRPLIYGAILTASILFLPDGLESLGPKVKQAFARGRERAGEGASG